MTSSKLGEPTDDLDVAVAALRSGGLVVYPTETVYGLAADASSPAALATLLKAKGRDTTKGLSVLVESLDAVSSDLVSEVSPAAAALSRGFWPGPLTLVLPAALGVASVLVGPNGGVGLRCSSDPLAARLVAAFGRPLTATSANVSGCAPAHTCAEAAQQFGASVQSYLDDGIRAAALVSTVVEFFDGSAYLRRDGAVTPRAVSKLLESCGFAPLES